MFGLGDVYYDTYNVMPRLITIKIVGNAFVYHQVRNMVGALVAGSLEPAQISTILEA